MGIFGKLFGDNNSSNETQAPVSTTNPIAPSSEGILNLNKGDILDLNKYSTTLQKIRAAAGWDVNRGLGADYDLDLCAYLISQGQVTHTVYYHDKRYQGIFLDGDNLTGKGDGDDENIFVELNRLPANVDKIIFAVVIYSARERRQSFGHVKNAYMRLVDESNGREICRYLLTEDGGDNTAATLAALNKVNGSWQFEAIGRYSRDSIGSLGNKL